jgi:hypothetical protein
MARSFTEEGELMLVFVRNDAKYTIHLYFMY